MKFYKPKFWDIKKFTIWPYLLLPLSTIVILANFVKFRLFKKERFHIPVITVGNIYVGGTGKTPLCIEIYKILKMLKINPAFVKKYYKKFEDENKLLKNIGKMFLAQKRSKAIKLLIDNKFQAAILDDGFQDPRIRSNMSIICFDEKQWIGNGFVIPSGPLREKLNALKRCDYVFVKGNQNFDIEKIINNLNSKIKIFYMQSKLIGFENLKNKKVFAFSGIGNPQNFYDLLKKHNIEIVKTENFPDHYNFTKNDILKLNKEANNLHACLVTTEKDYLRLKDEDKQNINCLKVELMIDKKNEFIEELKKII